MENNLVNKFLSFSIGSVLTMIIGVISTPIITRMVSPSDYGIYSIFTMLASLSSVIMIFGVDHSYARFYYEEDNKGEFLYKCLKIVSIVIIVYCIIISIIGQKLTEGFYGFKSNTLLVLLVVNSIFLAINRFALLSVRMQQNGKLYSILQVIQKILFVILFIILTIFNNNYLSLIWAITISNIVVTVLIIILDRKTWSIKNITSNNFKIDSKKIFLYGSPMVLTFMSTWIFQSADKFFIRYFNGYKEVGIYASALSIINIFNIIQTSFTTFWSPVSFQRYKEDINCKEFFKKISEIISFIMFIAAVVIILFKDIIILFLGSDYREASFIIPFLVFIPVMYTISETTVIGINFKMKPKYHIYISIIVLVANLIGNSILVPMFGAIGAAISTGVSYILFLFLRTIISTSLYNFGYNMLRLIGAVIVLLILTVIATINIMSLKVIFIGIVCLIVYFIMYRDVVKELKNYFFEIYKNLYANKER